METQTRLSRHNKFISAENIVGIFSVSSDDSFYMLCIVPEIWCEWGVTVRIQKINRKIKEIKNKIKYIYIYIYILETGNKCNKMKMYKYENTRGFFHIWTFSYIYIYIVIHRQTVSLYHNSSVWLDTMEGSSLDRNPPYFTFDR